MRNSEMVMHEALVPSNNRTNCKKWMNTDSTVFYSIFLKKQKYKKKVMENENKN